MAQVTGGTVSVEDGLKKQEEYAPPRKVRVDLNFAVAEGENFEAVFDLVSNAATNRVHSLLHGTKIAAVNAGVGVSPAPAVAEDAASPPAPAVKRTRRTAAQIEADNAAKNGGPSQTGSGGVTQTSGDPADIGGDDPTGGEESVVHLPDESGDSFDIEAPAAEDSFDIEAPAAGGEPITDADLNSAVQKKNAEIADPNAIRALIGSYNPDPKAAFQLRQIDPAKRAEFLAKLGALKKAG